MIITKTELTTLQKVIGTMAEIGNIDNELSSLSSFLRVSSFSEMINGQQRTNRLLAKREECKRELADIAWGRDDEKLATKISQEFMDYSGKLFKFIDESDDKLVASKVLDILENIAQLPLDHDDVIRYAQHIPYGTMSYNFDIDCIKCIVTGNEPKISYTGPDISSLLEDIEEILSNRREYKKEKMQAKKSAKEDPKISFEEFLSTLVGKYILEDVTGAVDNDSVFPVRGKAAGKLLSNIPSEGLTLNEYMDEKRRRQKEGIQAMKDRNDWSRYGRPSIMKMEEFAEHYKRVLSGELTTVQLIKELDMKKSTFYSYLKRYKNYRELNSAVECLKEKAELSKATGEPIITAEQKPKPFILTINSGASTYQQSFHFDADSTNFIKEDLSEILRDIEDVNERFKDETDKTKEQFISFLVDVIVNRKYEGKYISECNLNKMMNDFLTKKSLFKSINDGLCDISDKLSKAAKNCNTSITPDGFKDFEKWLEENCPLYQSQESDKESDQIIRMVTGREEESKKALKAALDNGPIFKDYFKKKFKGFAEELEPLFIDFVYRLGPGEEEQRVVSILELVDEFYDELSESGELTEDEIESDVRKAALFLIDDPNLKDRFTETIVTSELFISRFKDSNDRTKAEFMDYAYQCLISNGNNGPSFLGKIIDDFMTMQAREAQVRKEECDPGVKAACELTAKTFPETIAMLAEVVKDMSDGDIKDAFESMNNMMEQSIQSSCKPKK